MSSATGSYGLTEWLNRQLCYARIESNDRVAGYCEELLRLAAGGWQPIATAPTREFVLVFSEVWGTQVAANNDGDGWYTEFGKELGDRFVTHWQPLPVPPAAPATTEQP